MLTGLLLFAFQQFAGINAIIYFSSTVFRQVGIHSDVAASALVGLANVLGEQGFVFQKNADAFIYAQPMEAQEARGSQS